MFYLYFFLALVAILSTYFLCKYVFFKNNEKFNAIISKILKITVIVYCSLVFLTILLPDAFSICYGANEVALTAKEKTFAIVRWFSTLSFVMLPLAVFFKNRTIRNIAIYFCLSMTIVSLIHYPTFLNYYTSTAGRGLNSISVLSQSFKNFLLNPIFRSFVIAIQWLLEFIIIIVLAFQEKHIFDFKNKKEYLYFFTVLIASLVGCIPIYVPQHIFGYTSIIFKAWSIPHILWLVLVVGLLFSLYYIFRNKSRENKLLLCFIMSLSLVLQYTQMFSAISINIERLPFQLCNIGAYLILFSLITQNKSLFNFTVIVNVVGVMFALSMPDLDGEGLFYLYNMHFVLEHTNVLIIPILALAFKLFPRLDKKSLKDCLIGFSIYFVSVLFLGTLFNTIASITNNSFYYANYLFMFDKVKAVKLIPSLGVLFDIKFNIGKHIVFYPVLQILVFIVFTAVCIGMYYLIQLIYLIKDKIIQKTTSKDVANASNKNESNNTELEEQKQD